MKVLMPAAGIGARPGIVPAKHMVSVLQRFGGNSLLQNQIKKFWRMGSDSSVSNMEPIATQLG